MGCKYSRFGGLCSLSIMKSSVNPNGCTDEFDMDEEMHYCGAEDDYNPSSSCEMYESDFICPICGQDLNIEECECTQEDDKGYE